MIWNKHSDLEGLHAIMSASQYHWLSYDDDKWRTVLAHNQAKEYGTRLHEFASEAIKLRKRLRKTKETLNLFVNDAIGYKMESEQVLFYSRYCFGTADAISFNERENMLRIHDLKTGETKASMKQLMIYAAIFCLEYNHNPEDIKIELRIYQYDDVVCYIPDPSEIREKMDKIINDDKVVGEFLATYKPV